MSLFAHRTNIKPVSALSIDFIIVTGPDISTRRKIQNLTTIRVVCAERARPIGSVAAHIVEGRVEAMPSGGEKNRVSITFACYLSSSYTIPSCPLGGSVAAYASLRPS